MFFSWFRSRRRTPRPFPPEWEPILARSVRQVRWLDAAEIGKLRQFVAEFVAAKQFEGCGGLTVSDEMRLAIAGQAGLVTLGFEGSCFERLRSVLVYPGDYIGPRTTPLAGGGEIEWKEARAGETWAGGSMVLSWPGVRAGGRLRDGPRSVVIHECAHLVDLEDGDIDGVPPLPSARARREWVAAMADCRDRFDEALDEGRFTAFDEYAAESPAEFFAVASECFFQDPRRLARYDAILYRLLVEAWRQDPQVRVPLHPGRG
ncbi:MAG: zinc-dependent peptidase [Planctomycetia bacterium]|jgi:Mlc titration factor MtfA (ptsG expression regulator)